MSAYMWKVAVIDLLLYSESNIYVQIKKINPLYCSWDIMHMQQYYIYCFLHNASDSGYPIVEKKIAKYQQQWIRINLANKISNHQLLFIYINFYLSKLTHNTWLALNSYWNIYNSDSYIMALVIKLKHYI